MQREPARLVVHEGSRDGTLGGARAAARMQRPVPGTIHNTVITKIHTTANDIRTLHQGIEPVFHAIVVDAAVSRSFRSRKPLKRNQLA
jgi:hypothetical protein